MEDAAEEENIRINVRGTSSAGKCRKDAAGARRPDIRSRNPDARSIPTATISPTRVGIIFRTIFYTMSVYFMTAGVKRSRYTLAGALLATFAGLAASVILADFIV